MKALDLKSTLVAGAIGAVVFYLIVQKNTDPLQPVSETTPGFTSTQSLGYGFLTGAIVQIGVRMIGVS